MTNGFLATVARGATDQVYCYHFNPVGSTVAITDGAQNIVSAYSYDPFGNIAASQENMNGTQPRLAGQPFKFVGQFGVMTEPSGFYYMRARYYDPQVGRFISEDPAGFGGGDTNLSIYAGDNPVNGIDPEGKDGFSIGLEGAGALFGFGGTGGIYANFSHNSSKPWYAGWSSSVTVVAGGGAAASVYGLTGGVYVGVNNTDNVSQLNGTFVNGGRLGEVVPGIRTAI